MLSVLYEFFGILGVDITPPQTMAELIPYVLTVSLAVAVVWFILRMFQYFVGMIISGGRKF